MNDSIVPRSANALGYAGLLPFMACAGTLWFADGAVADAAQRALLTYAVVILSFMGAVHWGLAIAPRPAGSARDPGVVARMLTISVMPALVGWAALFMPARPALMVLVVAFAALLAIDRRYVGEGFAPAWYWRLRVPLTLGVCASLLAALAKAAVPAA